MSIPLRLRLTLTEKTGLAALAHLEGCRDLRARIQTTVDVRAGDDNSLTTEATAPTVNPVRGRCSLNVTFITVEDLRQRVRSAVASAVRRQDIPARLRKSIDLTSALEPLGDYLSAWRQVMDAWLRADVDGYQIEGVTSTGRAIRIHLTTRIRPQIAFGDPALADPEPGACPPPEQSVCLPLALVMPRERVLREASRLEPEPSSGLRLIPIAGRDLASLRHFGNGHVSDLVFLSGSVAAAHQGREVSMRSENVLAEAASWLEDEQRWPQRTRPASLEPLYRQSQSLQQVLEHLQFDLGSNTTLSLHGGRVAMSVLRITDAELRALLRLTGRAELDIELGRL